MGMFWYHTPSLLHSIFPNFLDICCRCGSTGGTLFQLFWGCPRTFLVYGAEPGLMGIGSTDSLGPLAYLLNVPLANCIIEPLGFCCIFLTMAKCLISAFWKQRSLPSVTDLHSRVKEIRRMEHLYALLNNKIYLLDSMWSLWDQYTTEYSL